MFYERNGTDAEPLLELEQRSLDLEEGGEKINLRRSNPRSGFARALPGLGRIFALHRYLAVLKPSFIGTLSGPPKPVRPTAWLDGLRGMAAFIVFIYHFQYEHHSVYADGYDLDPKSPNHWIIQLPVFRLFYNGSPMVSIFWVLSGVALSLRPLQLARAHDWKKFFDALSSSIFRRMSRLYLPCVALTFIFMICVRLGFYDYGAWQRKEAPFFHQSETQPYPLPTVRAQLGDWLLNTWLWANPFANRNRHRYNPHLWTIPAEFKFSIILFATLVGLAKLKTRWRLACVWSLYWYCIVTSNPGLALFYSGMACAEYMLVLGEQEKQLAADPLLPVRGSQRIPKFVWAIVFYIGLHFLSGADNFEKAFGFQTLAKITPKFIPHKVDFWRVHGATMLLFSLAGGKYLQILFANRFTVYLGKISFPLYMIHGPTNHMLGYRLINFVWRFTGKDTFFQYETGVVITWCFQAMAVIWFADIAERLIDQPSVNFGRWLQKKWSVA